MLESPGDSLPLLQIGTNLNEQVTALMLGYVGPAGIGALGVLLAVAAVVLIGAAGLVLHPLRLFLKHRRRVRQDEDLGLTDLPPGTAAEESDG